MFLSLSLSLAAGFFKTFIMQKKRKPSPGRPIEKAMLVEGKRMISTPTQNGLDYAFAKLHEMATALGWKNWNYISVGNSGPIYAKRTR